MVRATVREKVAALPEGRKRRISQMAREGASIVEIARRYKLDWGVVRALLWEQGVRPWRGSKTIITLRLRSLGTAGRQERRAELIKDVQQEVDYLYYAARRLQTQLDRAKKTIT